jgi:hypothetical protein
MGKYQKTTSSSTERIVCDIDGPMRRKFMSSILTSAGGNDVFMTQDF